MSLNNQLGKQPFDNDVCLHKRLPIGKLWDGFGTVIYQGEFTKYLFSLYFHVISCPYHTCVDKSIHSFIHSLTQIHIFIQYTVEFTSRFMNRFCLRSKILHTLPSSQSLNRHTYTCKLKCRLVNTSKSWLKCHFLGTFFWLPKAGWGASLITAQSTLYYCCLFNWISPLQCHKKPENKDCLSCLELCLWTERDRPSTRDRHTDGTQETFE